MNRKFLFIILLMLGLQVAYAAPDITVLEKIDIVTKEDMHAYSPLNGVIGMDKILKNSRYFGNNGLKEDPRYHCIAKNRKETPNKCPQDYVAALIQWFFPSYLEDGNFTSNDRTRNQDLVASMTPVTVGKILNVLSQANIKKNEELIKEIAFIIQTDNQLKEVESANLIIFDEKAIIENEQNIQKAEENTKLFEIGKRVEEYNNSLKTGNINPNMLVPKEEAKLWNAYQTLLNKRAMLFKGKPKETKNPNEVALVLAQTIVGATEFLKMQKEENELNPSTIYYHPDIVQMTLLAFAWDKSNNKSDVVNMLKEMKNITSENINEYFINETPFDKESYLKLKNEIMSVEGQNVPWGKWFLAAIGKDYYDLSFPKEIPYAQVYLLKNDPFQEQKITEQKEENIEEQFLKKDTSPYEKLWRIDRLAPTFPDCGASSLKNVFQGLIFDVETGTFKPEWVWDNTDNIGYKYFKKHKTVGNSQSTQARQDWAYTTARRQGINYVTQLENKEGTQICEINEGLQNILNVLASMLEIDIQKSDEFVNTDALDTLLKIVNEKTGADWSWNIANNEGKVLEDLNKKIPITKMEGPYDREVNIIFYKKEEPIFMWLIMPGHFHIKSFVKDQDNWLNQYKDIVGKSQELFPPFFPLFLQKEEDLSQLEGFSLSPQNLSLVLYSQDLFDPMECFYILDYISENNKFLQLGKNLIDHLKPMREDTYARKQVQKASFQNAEIFKHFLESWEIPWSLDLRTKFYTKKALEKNKKLKKELTESEAKILVEALKVNKNVVSVRWWREDKYKEKDKVFPYLLDALKTNRSIEKVVLQGMDKNDVALLCDVLKVNKKITALNLAKNDLGKYVEETKCLFETLKTNKTIKQLVLAENEIGRALVPSLADFIKINRTIQDLDLNLNEIGDSLGESLRILADGLKQNQGLLSVTLSGNSIKESNQEILSDALKENKVLTMLVFSEFDKQRMKYAQFENALKETKIKVIFAPYNEINRWKYDD